MLRYIPNKGAFKRACPFSRVLTHLYNFGVIELGVWVVLSHYAAADLFLNNFWRLGCYKRMRANRTFAVSPYLFWPFAVNACDATAAPAFWALQCGCCWHEKLE